MSADRERPVSLRNLTPHQVVILNAILAGKRRKQVAVELGCCGNNVTMAVRLIRRNLGVNTDIELGAWAQRNGLMPERT